MPVTLTVEAQNGRTNQLVINRLIAVDGIPYVGPSNPSALEQRVARIESVIEAIANQFPSEEGAIPP